jgi:DNA-binding NarL/FixJ family response regulator
MPTPNFYKDFLNSLTNREYEIVLLLAERLTSKEIAQKLNSCELTVKKHREHIAQKAHIEGRTAMRQFIRDIKSHLP